MKERKKALRNWIAQQKSKHSEAVLCDLSVEVMNRLEQTPEFKEAQTIFIYHSMKDEVHTHDCITKWSRYKNVVLPVVMGNELELRRYTGSQDLTISAYGIAEPIGAPFTDYDSIDLAVIPGVCFDATGHRLGRGKGYYDRLLPLIKATKIGVCFPFQLVEEVPSESFDIRMDKVIYS